MKCSHGLPFEARCGECLTEALKREQARSAQLLAVQPTPVKSRGANHNHVIASLTLKHLPSLR
jgi:hypothetical protein